VLSDLSGHYQSYGINLQATFDADCQFSSMSVLCPGRRWDSKEFGANQAYLKGLTLQKMHSTSNSLNFLIKIKQGIWRIIE
jgi:hypothetical protein